MDSESFAVVTDIIPTSTECDQGVGPMKCMHVPPISTSELRWKVDGTRDKIEYNGATQLPYTLNTGTLGGNGTLYFQRVIDTSRARPQHFLFVYFENIPVTVEAGAPFGRLHVYVDYDRFEGATESPGTEDRRFELSFITGSVATAGGPTWGTSVATPSALEFRSLGCVKAADNKTGTCNGELRIPLHTSAYKEFSDIQPGIGIFVRHVERTAGMPELAAPQYPIAKTNRTLWQTLLFGKPRGFPLKVMSWNVNRNDDDDFEQVENQRVGEFLAELDIVALQEVWEKASAEEIQHGANAVRAAKGLPLYYLYGPVDFDPQWYDVFLSLSDGVEETQGGLFILSHLQLAREGTLVFSRDDCRGNDCFHAKGVQWVRLSLNPPDSESPACREGRNACPKPPSGDDYIDVFNLHLQTSNSPLCQQGDWPAIKTALIAALNLIPYGWIASLVLLAATELIEADMHCTDDRSDQELREDQLVAANNYIDTITSQNRDRPSLVMGTFNIDGRDITNEHYQKMLRLLAISEAVNPEQDLITWTGFDGDVDHGDVARERADLDFTTGLCLGTTIGKTGGEARPDCPNDGMFEGDQRTSFILVRPHVPLSIAKTIQDPRWYMWKGEGLTWQSPFPSQNGSTGGPPDRLSDHKPVVASVQMTPMAIYPKYHPGWKHKAWLRVSSVDAAHITDCWGCGEVDTYPKLWKYTFPSYTAAEHTGDECTDKQQLAIPTDGCMSNWLFELNHTPQFNGATIPIQIWEDDNASDNEWLSRETESKVTFNAGNGEGAWDFWLRCSLLGPHEAQQKTFRIRDTAPELNFCDSNLVAHVPGSEFMARVCHVLVVTETPPQAP